MPVVVLSLVLQQKSGSVDGISTCHQYFFAEDWQQIELTLLFMHAFIFICRRQALLARESMDVTFQLMFNYFYR